MEMPPPTPCLVHMGIPALHSDSISRLIVRLDTSKRSASSGAVTLSLCSSAARIPTNLSTFI